MYICNHQNIFSCFSTQHNFFAQRCSVAKFLLGYRFMIYCRYGLIDLIWSVVMRQNSRNNSQNTCLIFSTDMFQAVNRFLMFYRKDYILSSIQFLCQFFAHIKPTHNVPRRSPYRSVLVVMSLTIIWPKQDLSICSLNVLTTKVFLLLVKICFLRNLK